MKTRHKISTRTWVLGRWKKQQNRKFQKRRKRIKWSLKAVAILKSLFCFNCKSEEMTSEEDQDLNLPDLLGLTKRRRPKLVKAGYANVQDLRSKGDVGTPNLFR